MPAGKSVQHHNHCVRVILGKTKEALCPLRKTTTGNLGFVFCMPPPLTLPQSDNRHQNGNATQYAENLRQLRHIPPTHQPNQSQQEPCQHNGIYRYIFS